MRQLAALEISSSSGLFSAIITGNFQDLDEYFYTYDLFNLNLCFRSKLHIERTVFNWISWI